MAWDLIISLAQASLQDKQRPIPIRVSSTRHYAQGETYQASEAQMDPPKFLVLGAAGYIGGGYRLT